MLSTSPVRADDTSVARKASSRRSAPSSRVISSFRAGSREFVLRGESRLTVVTLPTSIAIACRCGFVVTSVGSGSTCDNRCHVHERAIACANTLLRILCTQVAVVTCRTSVGCAIRKLSPHNVDVVVFGRARSRKRRATRAVMTRRTGKSLTRAIGTVPARITSGKRRGLLRC